MTNIIAALQEEIAAAQKKKDRIPYAFMTYEHRIESVALANYIAGLHTAVALLTQETARELSY